MAASQMTPQSQPIVSSGDDEARARVVTKAVRAACRRLGLRQREVAVMLGLSESTVSRLMHGGYLLREGDKPYELGVLLVRLFRSLDALVGGDEGVARAWLRAENDALGGRPVHRLAEITGVMDVLAYLDARRACL
ncbi:antitoxin Xre/MbcA/ParS toxin-binding domain-containing protein [Roseospira visakhapatnamensis]|uniref:Transcriptional regulator with XRE-family HTH domain n=1 Tax=Roseospira visakhapatnamensis TaxID=390880 RepID=A0A7W6WAI8_9PROT|nr:antitoxin Xre/MbcA/ParS toxin-binding domain-containing protein [Roseospira visakhapatnamensis]MBB4266541.1 transcriptional regulator with XRE-family HTH domain [Roseospira visakhapatnamensis]